MDKRQTLQTGERFLGLLKTGLETGEKVSMLVDDEGVIRMDGVIKSIGGEGKESKFEMQDGRVFPVDKIIAIDGIFRSDYSEC